MTINYILNIPAGPNNPSQDQPDMQINTNSIAQYVAVDHVPFGNVTFPNGYHTVIHQTLQGSDPALIANINQLYTKNYTPNTTGGVADTQLFARTGLGGISQLTGNLALQDGWQWIGGILLQWGFVSQVFATNTTITGTVKFKDRVPGAIPFPNDCFIVGGTLARGLTTVSQAANTLTIVQNPAISKTAFTWQVRVESSSFIGFFWWAIGN